MATGASCAWLRRHPDSDVAVSQVAAFVELHRPVLVLFGAPVEVVLAAIEARWDV